MIVYLGIYASLCLASIAVPRQYSTFLLLIAGTFLIWFMGFRYEVGCDYYGYVNRWENFTPLTNLSGIFSQSEIGFALLIGSVRAFGLGYTWLNVSASIILVFCYIAFARKHRYGPLILALLFPVIITQLGMSGLRQAIAGGFLMLAFNAIMFRQKGWAAVWILIGMQFHTSAVVFLPLALLAGREVNTIRLTAALAVVGPVAAIFLADRMDVYNDRYIAQIYGTQSSGGAIFRYALIALPVPFFVWYRKQVSDKFPDVYPMLKLMAIMIVSLAPLVVFSSIALHRFNYYVMPGSILLCVYVGTVIFKKTYTGQLLALLMYGVYSLVWFLTSQHAHACYLPYQNTWLM